MCYIAVYLSALLFAVGLGIGGMTNPNNIIGFLDIFGDWQPALLLVMVGAIGFHSITYYFITKRSSPIFEDTFHLPKLKEIDKRLIIGSAIFGSGWGLGGFCPGPAITSLVLLDTHIFVFVGSMILGIALFQYIYKPLCMGEKQCKSDTFSTKQPTP